MIFSKIAAGIWCTTDMQLTIHLITLWVVFTTKAINSQPFQPNFAIPRKGIFPLLRGMQNTSPFNWNWSYCMYWRLNHVPYNLLEDEDFAFPSDTFVYMKKGILPVGQIYDSQYEINWVPAPSSYRNQLSNDNGKNHKFVTSHPSPGIGKMKKNNRLLSERSFFIPELDPTMLNDFKENLVTMVLCTWL